MQKLLYYPNFEIEDMDFLKFCLLYVDEIKPIIPMCAIDSLSSETRDIMNHTNLIQPIHPDHADSELASIAAIELLEKQDISIRYSYRGWDSIHVNDKNDILYGDKFSREFEHYCLEKGIGVRCDEGIKVNQDVAYSYMSILANIISTDRQLDMITDSYKYTDIHLKERGINRNRRMALDRIKREIEFQIPVDMWRIPLQEFIRLRADDKFNEARQNFAKELNNVLDVQHDGISAIDMYDYTNCKNEIYGLVKEFFVSCAVAAVGVYSVGSAMVAPCNTLAFFANVGNGVLSLDALKHSMTSGKKYVEQLEQKQQRRRYLAELNRLGLGRL